MIIMFLFILIIVSIIITTLIITGIIYANAAKNIRQYYENENSNRIENEKEK